MKPKPHGGKRQGAGRPKGATRGRKKNKSITFRVSPERHARYAKAAGGKIRQAWICAALDEAVERQVSVALWVESKDRRTDGRKRFDLVDAAGLVIQSRFKNKQS